MLKGMTAYTGKNNKIKPWIVSVEIWSYNHKFLQIDIFVPGALRKHTQQIEEKIRSKLKRGKVTVKVDFLHTDGGDEKKIYYNKDLAEKIYQIGKFERKKGEDILQMRDILSLPRVIEFKPQSPNFDKLWPRIDKLISTTLMELVKIKKTQGYNTSKVLREIIENIDKSLNKIRKTHNKDKSEFGRQLKEKIRDISSIKIDESNLLDEAISFIKNNDISEEVTRVSSYLSLLKEALKGRGPVGKKIDFIAQELLREVNTIGSKKENFYIKKEVVNMKEEIEKIREQSQNIE